MTIKRLYDWAVEHGVEDYEMIVNVRSEDDHDSVTGLETIPEDEMVELRTMRVCTWHNN